MKKKILYLSYDGLLEPLGYSQIISYMSILSEKYEIWIISFEKKKDIKNTIHYKSIKNIMSKKNIKWTYLNFNNKKIFGILKFLDIIKFIFTTLVILKKNKFILYYL